MTGFDALVDDFLAYFWSMHPVDASFAGVAGYDGMLPPCGASAAARERSELAEFTRRLAAAGVPDSAAARIDAQLLRGYITNARGGPGERTRFANPAWYTGEIAFGVIALLLPGPVARDPSDVAARIAAIPDHLAAARAQLDGRPVPADWVERARREAAAVVRLLEDGLALHPAGAEIVTLAPTADAVTALRRFDAVLAELPDDADPAAGGEFFVELCRDVHGFTQTPAEIERDAVREFDRLRDELDAAAARLDRTEPWRACVERLAAPDSAADTRAELQAWNARALDDARELLTPAGDYGLTYAPLPAWARSVADDLYFLFYRSPPAYAPGSGSMYWVTSPQSTAVVKLVHAVHHGSIGHHTQNAHARAAESRLARIAGSDGASGIALLGGGTMVEGWACYAEELLAEVPDFYTAPERLLLTAFELRNVATCLGDIRLHTGIWTLDDMRRFYREDAAFADARVWSETTRNSIYPASRVMYWMGTRQIRALRAASQMPAKAFHDRLLAFGAAPLSTVAAEMQGTATLR